MLFFGKDLAFIDVMRKFIGSLILGISLLSSTFAKADDFNDKVCRFFRGKSIFIGQVYKNSDTDIRVEYAFGKVPDKLDKKGGLSHYHVTEFQKI